MFEKKETSKKETVIIGNEIVTKTQILISKPKRCDFLKNFKKNDFKTPKKRILY